MVLPSDIAEVLAGSGDVDLTGLKLLVALPEWRAPLVGGDTASQADVLALARNDRGLCVIAVEAKVDEDFGPTVGEQRADASPGQRDRLAELQRLLGVSCLPDAIRYQLVHRTISAMLTAREFHAHVAVMLVHSFGSRSSLRADFDAFSRVLGAKHLSDDVLAVPSFQTPRLLLAWCDGDRRFLQVDLLFVPCAPADAAPEVG